MDSDGIIPLTEKDITSEWITKATGLKPTSNSISIDANIQEGVGFLSNLCRVSFETDDEGTINVLVKLLPSNPEFRALTISERFDEREIQFYSIAAPQIFSVAPEIEKNFCKYYCGNIRKGKNDSGDDHASMLIIEDLRPQGYQMYHPEDVDKWEKNLEDISDFMAKFHSTWLPLEVSKNKKISELFPFCMGIGDADLSSGMLMEMVRTNLPRLDDFLEKHDYAQAVKDAYKSLGQYPVEMFVKINAAGAKFPCLIHGDIWPPNVMVAENPDLPVKVIDWQLLGFKDPSYEVTVAILTCLPINKLNLESVNHFTIFYYQKFLQYTQTAGFGSNDQIRTEEEFLEFFNSWGMSYAFLWFLLSFDSFPNGIDRLVKVFQLLHEAYKVPEFLLSQCK